MTLSNLFLTPSELRDLTHRVRPKAQVRALRQMGIEHRVRPDSSVAVLRSHIQIMLGGKQQVSSIPSENGKQPNWSAI